MDIEKLIKEQERTREAIGLLRKSKNFEQFFKGIEKGVFEIGEDPTTYFSDWDYKKRSKAYDSAAGYYIKSAYESLSKAKVCLSAMSDFYNGRVKEWERYREHCKNKNAWVDMFSNPDCIKFFDDYEKAHHIVDSINQQAKKERGRKKEMVNDA